MALSGKARSSPGPRSRPAALPSRQVYDVVVLGCQLGGAVAGALLAKRGLRVLHVDHDGVHERYVDGGYLLPYAPSLLPQLREVPAAKGVLEELGLLAEVGRELVPHESLQVLLPDARLTLPLDPEGRARELARGYGEKGAGLASTLSKVAGLHASAGALLESGVRLPADGFFERFAVSRLARRHAASLAPSPHLDGGHPLTEALSVLQPFTTYLDDVPPGWAFGRTVSPLLAAPSRFPGGREGLFTRLRETIARNGGDLAGDREHPAIAEELLLEGGRFAGVQLHGASSPHRARVCIAATDAAALRRLVPPSRRQRKLSDLADAVRARRFLFTVNLVVKERALPPGLGALAILSGLPARADEEGEARVLLEVSETLDEKGEKVPGHRTLTAAAFVESHVRDLGEEGFRDAVARLRNTLEEVLPFHERHLVLESAPYLAAVGSRGSRLLPHPLLEISLPRKLGVEGLPPVAPIGRMLFAGREVLPGLGLEGEWLAGLRAAELAAEWIKKVDPLV